MHKWNNISYSFVVIPLQRKLNYPESCDATESDFISIVQNKQFEYYSTIRFYCAYLNVTFNMTVPFSCHGHISGRTLIY